MLDLDFVRTKLPAHVLNPDPEIYRSQNYVALDFETTNYGKGLALYQENSLVLSVWSLGKEHPFYVPGGVNVYYSWANEYGQAALVAACQAADFLIAHNAKFELQWLDRCGLDLTQVVVWDSMIGDYVIGGNRWVFTMLSLENCAERHFGAGEGKVSMVSRMIKAGICPSAIPRSWLLEYCIKDVELTERLYHSQMSAMEGTRLLPVMYTRCLLTPVLADLEKHGMYIDRERVAEMVAEREVEYAQVLADLEEATGGINVNSTLQLREYLYETLAFEERKDRHGKPMRTPGGLPKTDADTIERLKATTAGQRRFLALYKRSRELYNELTKYLRKFDDCGNDSGGWLRGQFNQTNTQTHRLSSSGLEYKTQFQNFPRAYKPLFRSRHEGWFMGEADGAQLEFRVAGHLGRDRVVVEDLLAGTDIHSVTASVIWPNEAPDDPSVRHPRRQDAKEHTFKPLYGGRSGTPDEVRYYEFFREKYHGVAGAQRTWIDEVLDSKELETEWGLRYYWPNTEMTRTGYVTNTTSICNYPVQAFATAEIIPVGMVFFWHYVKAAGLRMLIVNTVHDSIIAEIPPEEVEVFDQLAYRCMVDEVYGYLDDVYEVRLTVPLAAGVSHGINWADKMAKDNEREYVAEDQLWKEAA